MDKEALSALVAEILGELGKEPQVKASDYKPKAAVPVAKPAPMEGFVEDVTKLDLRKLYLTEAPKKREEFEMKVKLLKPGCKGEDVRAVQILLMGRGYSCGNGGADGVFGNDTHSAVCAYQRAKTLEVDGIVGEQTLASLLGAA